jgi:hypothetical protein
MATKRLVDSVSRGSESARPHGVLRHPGGAQPLRGSSRPWGLSHAPGAGGPDDAGGVHCDAGGPSDSPASLSRWLTFTV